MVFQSCHLPLILKMMFLSPFLSLSLSYLLFPFRALWFVLEILMAKNENNSHAFIRKMVENIKQTKDGQCPDDPKINEVRLVGRMLCFFHVAIQKLF